MTTTTSKRSSIGCPSDKRGSVALAFGLCALVIGVAIGGAIDIARWSQAKRITASALDISVLAGARHLQLNPTDTSGAVAVAQASYQNNISHRLTLVSDSFSFAITDSNTAVSVTGNAAISTTLLNLVGIPTLAITGTSKAVLAQSGLGQGSNLEIAVMLDVTGSMCDDGTGPCTSGVKLSGVKQAAANLATIVLNNTSGSYTSRMAIVPFANEVRVDVDGSNSGLMQTLTGMPATWSGWMGMYSCTGGSGYYAGEIWVWTTSPTCTSSSNYVTGWKLNPCVTERTFDATIGFDPSDSVPGANNWLLGQGGDRFPLTWDSTNASVITLGSAGSPNFSGQAQTDPTYQWDYSLNGDGCELPQGNEIVPLTSQLSAITNKLNTLQAWGPTAGALGVVWTQYMLSPSWASIWTGSSAPGSYADTQTTQANGAPVLRKVAVLMTDGGFNTMREAITDYASDGGTSMQNMSNMAIEVCTNMKNNGVEIYTVGFNLNALSAGEQAIATATLQACGTDLSHFYNSLTVSQLNAAFTDIAVKMTPIRLSQ